MGVRPLSPHLKPCPMPPRTWGHPDPYQLFLGNCLDWLPLIPSVSVDAFLPDPSYPMIRREYGILTEKEWMALIKAVVREVYRILKPRGSAVFVLQNNSRRLGSMRSWLYDFQGWPCRHYNIVEDAFWWNHTSLPEAHSIQGGLMRLSVKNCVWIGPPDCYRDQDQVLWLESDGNRAERWSNRWERVHGASGHGVSRRSCVNVALRRGGVTPYNLIPCPSRGYKGHPAATPVKIADWWLRYICPAGGTVLDPFSGSGSVGEAALRQGKKYIGIEQRQSYHEIAGQRLQSLAA